MADNFPTYHIPQQSRRDKLRIINLPQNNHHHDHNNNNFQSTPTNNHLLPLYDPSSLLLPSNHFIPSCTTTTTTTTAASTTNHHDDHGVLVKAEGVNFMGSYLPLNPSSNSNSTTAPTTTNNNPFVCTPQSYQVLRDFDDNNYGSDQAVVFRPEVPLSLELNLQRYGGGSHVLNYGTDHQAINVGGGSISTSATGGCDFTACKEISRSNDNNNNYSVPSGPFTGYASILKGSRFLKPAQQLLEEFCYVSMRSIYGTSHDYNNKIIEDDDDDNDGTVSLMEPPIDQCSSGASNFVDNGNCGGGGDHHIGGESGRRKSILNSMLDEVYRRYKQYYQQMQEVIASFECVAGLGNAAPYANLALKTLSKHFRSLKNAITEHLQLNIKANGQQGHGKDAIRRLGNSTDGGIFSKRPIQNSGFIEHQPVWRPQRGLPERAVTVLRAWLFEHFLHPYPTDTDKIMLAKQTGLSRNQVSNWFINARVRLWKPMVEEIHMLETRQAQKASQRDERNGDNRTCNQDPLSNSIVSSDPSTSAQRAPQDVLSKSTGNQLPGLPMANEAPPNLSYNSLASNPHVGVGVSMRSRSNSVSLTLGLHQNNGPGLSEQFNAGQQFGLNPKANSEGYAMSGFEEQQRPFGGQLLHDFVG